MKMEKNKSIDFKELSIPQTFIVWWWILANKKKFLKFAQKLDDGMHIIAAYKTTKEK